MSVHWDDLPPMEIEKRSFEIIASELAEMGIELSEEERPVTMRCIHTSADFDYARNLVYANGAIEAGLAALKSGCTIVTDTQMAASGISKAALSKFGGEVRCFMSDEDVAAAAKERGVTRAGVSMEKAAALGGDLIFAIGNAPTALIRLRDLIRDDGFRPKLIIGAPVGFVNVEQSKELILETDVPCIVPRGRKGGSNIAACIVNALLYMAGGR